MRFNPVKSATRVLDLLELLATHPAALRIKEIATELDIPQSSASMLVATVEHRGYLERDGDRYRITRELSESGWVAGKRGVLLRAARPHMQKLTETTGESCFLGVLSRTHMLQYVEKVVSQSSLRYDADLRAPRAAYATTNGLALLAALPGEEFESFLGDIRLEAITPHTITSKPQLRAEIEKVRREGFSELRDTHVVGAWGLARAIHDANGVAVASLCVIAPSDRFKQKAKLVHGTLHETCMNIEQSLHPPGS